MADETIRPPTRRRRRLGHEAKQEIAAEWHEFLSRRLPGLPSGLGTVEWLGASASRMPYATAAALIATWTGIMFSLWIAVYTALGSVIIVLIGAGASGHVAGIFSFTYHAGPSLDVLTVLSALFGGFGVGFADSYTSSLASGLPEVAMAMLIGIVLAMGIAAIAMRYERTLLEWRGYRRVSEREARTLVPAILRAMEALGLREDDHPSFLMVDSKVPAAWAMTRCVAVSTFLLQDLDAGELQAILAHELAHWRRGDPIALRLVWAFSWPVAVMYHVGMFLSGARFGTPQSPADLAPKTGNRTILAAIGWFFLWPSYILMRYLIGPVTSWETRRMEYEADAAVVRAGLGPALLRALDRMQPFEPPRTAWEAVLSSSHPPHALRVEAIEEGMANTDDVEEPDHIRLSRAKVSSIFGLCLCLLAIAFAHYIPEPHATHHSWWNPFFFN